MLASDWNPQLRSTDLRQARHQLTPASSQATASLLETCCANVGHSPISAVWFSCRSCKRFWLWKSMPTVLTTADVKASSAYRKRNDVFPTLLLPMISSWTCNRRSGQILLSVSQPSGTRKDAFEQTASARRMCILSAPINQQTAYLHLLWSYIS